MSGLKGKVGTWELDWASIPRGATGESSVRLQTGEIVSVRWNRDSDGIWIELPNGVFGFDITAESDGEGGTTYRMSERHGGRNWAGLGFVRPGEEAVAGGEGAKKKSLRVRAQMPGKIVKIMVAAGAEVEKGQPLLVMEAMKMENEIRALQAGKVAQVKVAEGQAVESGADLIILE